MHKLIAFIAMLLTAWAEALLRPPRLGHAAGAMATAVAPDTTRTYNVAAGGAYNDAAGLGGSKMLPYKPGQVVFTNDGAKGYRFVKMTVAAAVVGDWLAFSTAADRFTVVLGSTNLPPAGLCVTAIAIGSYGWIQVAGLSDVACTTDGNVTIDGALSLTTSADCKPCTAGELITPGPCGFANTADTGTVQAAGLLRVACPVD